MPEHIISGPFHLVSAYYKRAETKYEHFETVADLKKHITDTMDGFLPDDIIPPSEEDSILLWIKIFINYGSYLICREAGYGCRCVITNGILIHENGITEI